MFISKDAREEIKDWATIAALLLAGAWALWTFIYEQRLKLLWETPYLRASVTVETPKPEDGSSEINGIPVYLRVTVENLSKRSVRVLSGQLDLSGDKLLPSPTEDFNAKNLAATLNKDKAARSRYWNARKSQLVFTGSAFHMWTFEPGEKQEFMRATWIPRGTFDQLEANVYIRSTPHDDNFCLVHSVDEKLQTDTLPGRLKNGNCDTVDPESADGKKLLQKIGIVESTAYLALARPKTAGPTSTSVASPSR